VVPLSLVVEIVTLESIAILVVFVMLVMPVVAVVMAAVLAATMSMPASEVMHPAHDGVPRVVTDAPPVVVPIAAEQVLVVSMMPMVMVVVSMARTSFLCPLHRFLTILSHLTPVLANTLRVAFSALAASA